MLEQDFRSARQLPSEPFLLLKGLFLYPTAFFTGKFWEWTREVSYWQEETDDSCWTGRRGKKCFWAIRIPFFTLEEVTECIAVEKWILRGHMDNGPTFGEDTLLPERWSKRILAAAKGLGYLCWTVPRSIGFIKLIRCPVWSGLSRYFNGPEECTRKSPGAGRCSSGSPVDKL